MDTTNIIISVIVTLLSGAIGAIIGTYYGALFATKRQEKRIKEVRSIALKGIGILKKYARKNQSYDMATDDFNNSISIAEKRAVIVALHKLGIPIQVLANEAFNIAKLSFAHQIIDKDELDAISNQIELGHCDNLFYMDPEKYFDDNLRQKTLRSVAKRWVLEVLVHSILSEDRTTVTYPSDWFKSFSLGERYAILVLKERIATEEYFDNNRQIIQSSIDLLLRDIDCGLWDNCLYWDYTNYKSVVSSMSTNMIVEEMFRNNANTQQPQQH